MEQIKQMIAQRVADALDGNENPLDVFMELRGLEDDVKFGFDLIRESAMAEAEKFKGQEYNGYLVNVQSSGRYSYDHIPEYVALKTQMKEMEKRYQESYKLSERMIAMVDDNGEQIPPASYKSTSPAIQLKLKK